MSLSPSNLKDNAPINIEQLPTCSFFVTRKKRNCKMLVSKGKRFCGQHLINDTENDMEHKRILCPLDPKHTCFDHKLEQHLKICNAREKTGIPCQSLGINLGEDEEEIIISQTPLKNLSDAELLDYIQKVQRVHEEHVGSIKEMINFHPALDEAISKPGIGPSVIRHLKQNSSLLWFMEEKKLLNSEAPIVYVEFGAGRGQLTGWLIKALKDVESSVFLLVDKGAQRYKVESKLKYTKNLKIRRIRIDIQDFNLERVEEVSEDSVIVACGKHLCGAATDFALRCLVQCQKGTKAGIVIALCCHHRCTWKSYTGKEFFKEVKLSGNDFPVLSSLTSWAVSGSRHPSNEDHDEKPEAIETKIEDQKGENRYKRLGLSVKFREEIGRKSKQIIDMGRVKYLKRLHNLEANLMQYVQLSSTLENIAIVAVPKNNNKKFDQLLL